MSSPERYTLRLSRQAEQDMCGKAGDHGGDDDADGGDHDDGDPDLLQHLEPQRRTAVEQDVACAEQQDDLVQRGIGGDIDKSKGMRADQDADDEEYRDVGNPDLLGEERRDCTDRQDQTAGEQRVPGDFDRGGH